MQLFPCLPTAHPLFSIIICFPKLLSINNYSRQRETSLLLISCHITSKTAYGKWTVNGDGFNFKHPDLLHHFKINQANAQWRHRWKFNPDGAGDWGVILGARLTQPCCGSQIVGRKRVPGGVSLAPATKSGPTPSLTCQQAKALFAQAAGAQLFKAKGYELLCPWTPQLRKEIAQLPNSQQCDKTRFFATHTEYDVQKHLLSLKQTATILTPQSIILRGSSPQFSLK